VTLSLQLGAVGSASCSTVSLIAAPRQRRGKSLIRRKGQHGHVFQKGRRRSDPWFKDVPAYVQFWQDVSGSESRRAVIALGLCRTRTVAERRAAEKLEELGVNSARCFVEATSSVTFKQQGEIWLKSLSARKRNPLEQTTIDTRRYALDKWIYPFFDGRILGQINNRAMKELVEHMAPNLSAATIRDYTSIVKGIVSSAINEDGEELFPRKWNEDYIDAPVVAEQRQPSTNSDGMAGILFRSGGQYRVLYALLAGCGPLRAGEALGLSLEHVSEDCRLLPLPRRRNEV
jgi:hypothetical protein